ncbi:MAG: hypothetical protein ACI835_003872 [Planctomycetota bacterium]|jgi:hypothetical protein
MENGECNKTFVPSRSTRLPYQNRVAHRGQIPTKAAPHIQRQRVELSGSVLWRALAAIGSTLIA